MGPAFSGNRQPGARPDGWEARLRRRVGVACGVTGRLHESAMVRFFPCAASARAANWLHFGPLFLAPPTARFGGHAVDGLNVADVPQSLVSSRPDRLYPPGAFLDRLPMELLTLEAAPALEVLLAARRVLLDNGCAVRRC
jgi:hypothetical protein